MSTVSATTVLADSLMAELAAVRAGGGGEYPVPLDRLAARLAPPPDPAAVLKAVGSKGFTAHAVVAVKGRASSPVALREDLPALAASPLTLEAALLLKGGAGAPPWAPKKLAAAVDKDLKADFLKAIGEWIEKGELPTFAVAVTKGKAVALHHRDHPPPPSVSIQNAERLVDLLGRRQPPGEAPPLTSLADLRSAAGLELAAFGKALKEPTFTRAVTQVKMKSKVVYAILSGNENTFSRFVTGTLLAHLIEGCSRANAHGFTVQELVTLVSAKAQQQVVAGVLNGPDLANDLPAGVGCVLVSNGKKGGQNVFFSLEHLRTARPVARPTAAPEPPADFGAAFDAAFARIDRERGSNNFVSLVDLRAALPHVPREAFDASLRELRRARRYVLSSDERYDGISTDQQAAAIREEGEFLLHVSRGRQ